MATMIVIGFLPHPNNKHQRHTKDCWPCILGNLMDQWFLKVIQELLAASAEKTDTDNLSAQS
jgi:hypothetical protein